MTVDLVTGHADLRIERLTHRKRINFNVNITTTVNLRVVAFVMDGGRNP